MAEVFAGFVTGFGLSLIFAPILAITLLRMRAESVLLDRLLPAGVNPVALTVVLQGGAAFFWTGLGVVLGLVLLALDGAPQALGSLNGPYTLIVGICIFIFCAPAALLIDPWRRQIIGLGLLTLATFGWLTPYLARWSKFD